MAGTLTISTLSDGTNSTSAINLTRAPCVAWANFGGVTTVTINASYNVSSITRNGTGDYTLNFTNALTDANYAVATTGTFETQTGGYQYFSGVNGNTGVPRTKTSAALRITTATSSTAAVDSYNQSVTCFR